MSTFFFWLAIVAAGWFACGAGALYLAQYVHHPYPECNDVDEARFILFGGIITLVGVVYTFLDQFFIEMDLLGRLGDQLDLRSRQIAFKISRLLGYEFPWR